MNDRLKRLVDLESTMINEQPFDVVSNKYGFDRLIELLDKSNYTFDDVDDALVDTYKMVYENAMSRMMVNTHTVITHCKSNDRGTIRIDKTDSRYYIVDVPFNQFHFGDRDEMIHHYIDKMFNHRSNYYMPMETLISNELSSVLNCTFICTTNGLINNDWGVAIDDKGFHFRIGWGRPYDFDLIIYKLDEALIDTFPLSISSLNETGFISMNSFGKFNQFPTGMKCLVNIYSMTRDYTTITAPNFGVIVEDGIQIKGFQKKTLNDIKSLPYEGCEVIVYGLKYLHELPNTYPCVNFMNMLYSHPIVTEDGLDVYTQEEKKVIGLSYDDAYDMPVCTPPISIDRSASDSFETVIDCLKLYDYMMNFESILLDIGSYINQPPVDSYYFNRNILSPAQNALLDLKYLYKVYIKGGIITSLVTYENRMIFQNFIDDLQLFVDKVLETPDINTARMYSIDEFYGISYRNLVGTITSIFNHPSLEIFKKLDKSEFDRNYFDKEDKNTRFTRPISEQCFIALKYSYDEECWVFTYPNIKHFHGIGNTFYVKDGLTGNEVFKFFFTYTDTEDPMNKNIEEFDFTDVFDFDKFSEEVDNYQGYIRYWNVENHLRKISNILYGNDSTDSQLQVLSKILLGKLNGEELLDLYPTDMNYEESNATSLDYTSYDENSTNAPFTLNFLFYTINMMYDNKDQLLSYFLRVLSKNKFSNRYSDIDISSVMVDGLLPVNYGVISIGSHTGTSHGIGDSVGIFCGIPDVIGFDIGNTYDYVFNRYDESTQYKFIDIDGSVIDDEYLDNVIVNESFDISYDVTLLKKMIAYIDYCADFMNFIETRYTYSFDICNQLSVYINKLNKYANDVNGYIDLNSGKFITTEPYLSTFSDSIADVIEVLRTLSYYINQFRRSVNGDQTIYDYLNIVFLKQFHVEYKSFGFDDYATDRIKSLYNHLIKINKPMNLYEFDKWVKGIDITLIQYLYGMMSNNPNTNINANVFTEFYTRMDSFITTASTYVTAINDLYDEISTTVYSNNIQSITTACFDDILNDANIELYAIDTIESNTPTLSTIPRIITGDITVKTIDGSTETKTIMLIPIWETVNGGYKLVDIRQHCSYAFIYNGTTTINPVNIKVYDDSGNTISSGLSFTITLFRVGNATDIVQDTFEACDVCSIELPFKNIHEVSVPTTYGVETLQHANLNFELLSGNRFIPLTSTHEYVFDRNSLIGEPMDIIHTSNSVINKLAKKDYGNHIKPSIYVKPVQVLHTTNSVGMKYYRNHRIYVKTNDDNGFVFPIIVRDTDHSQYQGFAEAVVDYNRSKWFKINDTDISTYVLDKVECELIPDNVCAFLDEFNNDEYMSYQFIPYRKNISGDVYTLPGDPIYVMTNSDYVHTRLNWIFGLNTPDRFIDQEHKSYDFVFIDSASVLENDSIKIFMLNHNFNTLTLPEMYPTLRDEPNDHSVHALEKETYTSLLEQKQELLVILQKALETEQEAYEHETDEYERLMIQLRIEDTELKIDYTKSFIERLTDYITQPESKTTWYNLYAYDDAITYINNGRAKMVHMPRIKDIIYSDKIEVRMYDWENKHWLNPNDFTITLNTIDHSTLDNHDVYETNFVQYSLMITPIDTTFHSKKVLIYFVYNKSDIYSDIVNPTTTFDVRFKPVLSTFNSESDSIYHDTRIRKHFDTNEVYVVDESYFGEDFSNPTAMYVKRIDRSGKYPTESICRFENVSVKSNVSHDYTDFDFYVRFPFNHILQDQYTSTTTFTSVINQTIDDYTENETITMVCISSNKFNGTTSDIMFTAKTIDDSIEIIDSSIHPIPDGEYICTVAKDPMYQSCGGIVSITVSTTRNENLIDSKHQWIKVNNPQYKIIPDEFILVPKNISLDLPLTVELHNIYVKDDTSTLNPYMYYYDQSNEVRYPFSNITHNDLNHRFEINQTTNPNVKKIKSNYIHVCRFSTQKIPVNGLLDFTGYIPTPLSRDRYEFWVNGRCLTDTNLSIISPTSVQLHNLKSLRNFELIELVDDTESTNTLFPTGSVYMDLFGNTFSSYTLMMLSNSNIRYQSIQYRFYFNTKSSLDTYTKDVIPNPNNNDIETDILSYLTISDTVTSYNEIFNIPSINGVPLHNPTTMDLGLLQIPPSSIFAVYDKVWSKEITTNPLFPITHRDLIYQNQYVLIRVYEEDNSFRIMTTGVYDKLFTIYISTSDSTSIQNKTTTKKIIPMINLGTGLLIDKSYRGMWIHTTIPNTTPVQIK